MNERVAKQKAGAMISIELRELHLLRKLIMRK